MIGRAFMVTALTLVVGATLLLRPLREISDFAGREGKVHDPSIRASEAQQAPEDGLPMQRNTILILFRDDAPQEEIDSLLRSFELTPRARLESPPLYVVESPPEQAREGKAEAARLQALIDALTKNKNSESLVIEAVQNTYLGPTVVPARNKKTSLVWDWHSPPDRNGAEPLRRMSFPQAWNFRSVIGNHNKVGVLDIGFDFITTHDDLTIVRLADADCIPTFKGHGQAVAGIIGAKFSNTTGIDGASPFAELVVCVGNSGQVGTVTDLTSTDTADAELLEKISPFSSHLRGLELLLKAGIPVINASLAYNWYQDDLVADTDPHIQKLVAAQGTMVRAVLKNHPKAIVVTAAGNECDELANQNPPPPCTRDAKWASPLNWAALGDPSNDQAKNVIVVEAADIHGNRLLLSNTGGTLMAIGQQVGTTSVANGYGLCRDSTSCAAPFVTATVSMMLAYNPNLTVEEIRSSLLQSTGNGRLLNAFKAVAASNPNAATDLANLDGTGGVDFADFEIFRKAFRQVRANSFVEDLNGDGPGKPDLNEGNFPRADLNGDGHISSTDTSFVPNVGNVTDLQVMMRVWTDTSVDKNTLPTLLFQ